MSNGPVVGLPERPSPPEDDSVSLLTRRELAGALRLQAKRARKRARDLGITLKAARTVEEGVMAMALYTFADMCDELVGLVATDTLPDE